jgi:glycosyltransferase involved in cell wall biosynthesis
MRILFLNKFLYERGGSERVMFNEVECLRQHGHDVFLFSRMHKENIRTGYEGYYPPEMDVQKRNSLRAVSTVLQIIYSHAAKKALGRFLDDVHIDIAHCHNIYGLLSTSVLDELSNRHIPTVLTLHDYKPICANYLFLCNGKLCERCHGRVFFWAVLRRCVRKSLADSTIYAVENMFNELSGKYRRKVTRYIAVSQFSKGKFVENGFDESRIDYVPNAVIMPEESASTYNDHYFLYFGRLSQEKGLLTLLHAFHESMLNNYRLVIAGDGPQRLELEKVRNRLGLSTVSFMGQLTRNALERYIRGATAVIVPSECYENCPMSILEAMSFGKLVIGARIGGIPELIADGDSGYLFRSRDAHDLCRKLQLIANLSDEKLKSLGEKAREKTELNHRIEMHYQNLMKAYTKAMQ